MKAVLMSIQPKWCELIANGKKTVEVRKTKPKLETPFKVYIYCTLGVVWADYCRFVKEGRGKVIGEFVCDTIFNLNELALFAGMDEVNKSVIEEYSCVDIDELLHYKGDKNEIYGWSISDLVIYDKPKELSEFKTPPCERPENACENCKYLEVTNTPNAYEVECYRENGVYLTRPPQSWCYVERSDNNGE